MSVLKLFLEHSVKIPQPEPTSRSPDLRILRTFTPYAKKKVRRQNSIYVNIT